MDVSNVELYEALKRGNVGEEAAKMLAEVVPPAPELVTKADLREEIQSLELRLASQYERIDDRFRQIDDRFREIDQRLSEMSEKFTRYMLLFFVPLWITAAAAIVTSVLGG